MHKMLYHSFSDSSSASLWGISLLRGALIVFFLFMAAKNLSGDERMAADFARWGYPEWFRVTTGLLQLCGALLLTSPSVSFYGALLLSCILVGAIATHVIHDPLPSALSPAVFILFTSLLCVFYRPDFLR